MEIVLNIVKENLGNFDSKVNDTILMGYSPNTKAYIVFNRRTLHVEEFMHVDFDEFMDLEKNPLE